MRPWVFLLTLLAFLVIAANVFVAQAATFTPSSDAVCSGGLCVQPNPATIGSMITIWYHSDSAQQVSIYLDGSQIFFKIYSYGQSVSEIITTSAPASIGPHTVTYTVVSCTLWGSCSGCSAYNRFVPCPILTFQVSGQTNILITTTGVNSAQMTVDGSTVTTPYSTTWGYPSTHTVIAPYIATVSSDSQGKFYDWYGYPPGQTALVINTPANPGDCFQPGPTTCRTKCIRGDCNDVCTTSCLQSGLKLTADYAPQYLLTVNNGGYGSTTQGMWRSGYIGAYGATLEITEPDVSYLQVVPPDTAYFWDSGIQVQYGGVYGISCGPGQKICTAGSYKVLSGYFESDPYNDQPLSVSDSNNHVVTGPERRCDPSARCFLQTTSDWQAWNLEFYGYYVAPKAGTYTLSLDSAQAAAVWVNGKLVIDIPVNQFSGTGSVQMQKGPNFVYVKGTTFSLTSNGYLLANGIGERLQLSGTGPDGPVTMSLTGTLYKWNSQWASQTPTHATDFGIQIGSASMNSGQTKTLMWTDKNLPGVASVAATNCPICLSPTDWSQCSSGVQTRTNYKCDSSTNFLCQSLSESRLCTLTSVTAAATHTFSFKPGWNGFSIPYTSFSLADDACGAAAKEFFHWNSGTQAWERIGLSNLQNGKAYLVYFENDCTVSVGGSGTTLASELSLNKNWNFVGGSSETVDASQIPHSCGTVKQFLKLDNTQKSFASVSFANPFDAYWVFCE